MRNFWIILGAVLLIPLTLGAVAFQTAGDPRPPGRPPRHHPPPPHFSLQPELRVPVYTSPVIVGVSNYYTEFANIHDGEATGLAVEVLRRAADRMGIELRFVYVSTDEAWDRLADGTVDVLAFQSVAEWMFDEAIYGPPYVVTRGRLYTRPGTPEVEFARELRGKRVVIDGLLARPWLSSGGVTVTERTNDVARAIDMLVSGEVDYYPTTRLAIQTSLRRANRAVNLQEQPLPGSVFYRAFASAVRPERRELHGLLVKGTSEVMASVEYPALYNKYVGDLEPLQPDDKFDRGSVLWGMAAAALVMLAGIGVMLSLRSSLRRQQRALASSQSSYRQLFEASEDAILVLSKSNGRVLDANPAATRIYGWSSEELRGMTITQITTNPEHAAECLAEVLTKGLSRGYACQHMTKDRGLIQIEATVALVDVFGESAFAVYLRDSTERLKAAAREREMEARLAQTQRLEGLALLAGGVAHDFNNLLMAISGNAELVRIRSNGDPRFEQPTSDIVRAARLATELTQQMLDTAGSSPVKSEPTSLTTVATELVAALGPRLGTRTPATLELDHALPLLNLDAPRLRRILMNVLTNAADATRAEGSITIRTGRRRLDRAQLASAAAGSTLPEGDFLVIEVEDTGEGMPEEVLARIFDPFFTTKPQGRGLGLSVMLGNVRRMGGAVLVRSKVGVGSCFTLAFPVAATFAGTEARQAPDQEPGVTTPPGVDIKLAKPRAAGEHGRALVVDDSAAVMGVTAALLTDLGWEVTTAATVESAAAELALGEFRLVVADVVMPGGGGAAVLAASREHQPRAAAILMSGHAPEGSLGTDNPDAFLQKPFGVRELEAAVRDATDLASGKKSARGSVAPIHAA
jgi:two-component system, cell cycle sensor histidine kinase and response regulator CckA